MSDAIEDLVARLECAEHARDYYRSACLQQTRIDSAPPFVPNIIRLDKDVHGDVPFGSSTRAEPGVYTCCTNRWGAVSIIATNGKKLGVKLHEFEVISWAKNALAPEIPV